MSAMERTTYRLSLGSKAWAFDEPRRDPQHAPYTSGPSTDFASDDSISLFLSDPHGQPDPREFAPLASSQRTSSLPRVAGGLVVSAFAILVAVFDSDVTCALIDKARASPPGIEAPAPSKTLDAETLAALMTRARRVLAFGDIAAARLLLERAANAQDATAAFLLAQTYDPAVLGTRDTRSITPDPMMARDWYCKAASFGSADAQQRLTQLQNNLHLSGGCHASVP